jgi:SAM-dependent methyltransferase
MKREQIDGGSRERLGMEHVACDLCQADEGVAWMERHDRFTGQPFRYVRCAECGLIYLDPRPDAGSLLSTYPENYEAYRVLDQLGRVARWRRLHALSLLRRFVARHASPRAGRYGEPGRLLDVGCATGEFLLEMRGHGWKVHGIEVSPEAATIARDAYGLEVSTGSIESFSAPGAYDVVTLWDVLEHLPSPRASLLQIRQWLRPGGHVVFSVPNLESWDARLFGRWWIGWDAPRHWNLFSRPLLERLLAETGFQVIDRRCFLGGPGAFMLSWRFWCDQKGLPPGVQRLSALAPYLLWPYKELAYALNRGPIVTWVAQKGRKE